MPKKSINFFLIFFIIAFFAGCENKTSSSIQNQENALKLPEIVEAQQFTYFEEKLDVEVSNNSIVKIKISSQNEYEKLISQLADYKECSMLYLDLQGKNITIYLDDLLAHENFGFLQVSNGGIISMREEDLFADNFLKTLHFKHVFQIKKFPVNKFRVLRNLSVWLDSQFETSEQSAEMINNNSCDNIIVLWEDDTYFGNLDFFEGYIERKEIAGGEFFENAYNNERYFKAFYKLNYNNISYVSLEFYNKNMELESYVMVEYKSGHLEILEVPTEKLIETGASCGAGQRIYLEDINFDGYKDIIFLGYNDGLELYHKCIGFLWNQPKQQYELEETLPCHFDHIDAERKRLIYASSSSAFDDSYCIYEYINGRFEEKRLDVIFDLNKENLEKITWKYYENGIFLEELVLNYCEDGSGAYVFYGRNGKLSEGVFPKEQTYSELGKQYFEEFDFYNHG